MPDIAVCVTVFKRIEKLNSLLHSIDSDLISTVYVADDGKWNKRKEEVYDQTFPFSLEVFDLEFDAGLGAGRHRIVQEFTEEYLLLMDSDMRMPANTDILLEQLQEDSNLGGVCGLFAEEERILTSGCMDIQEENDICKLEIREPKKVNYVANHPFINFDMIANGALFKRSCLEDYSWDPEYVIGREHVDFYVGHKRHTDWKFGLCPSVLFPHDPGGNEDFLTHRWNKQKYKVAHDYFLQKWGFDGYKPIRYSWIDTYDPEFGGHPPHRFMKHFNQRYRSEGLLSAFKFSCKEPLRRFMQWRGR